MINNVQDKNLDNLARHAHFYYRVVSPLFTLFFIGGDKKGSWCSDYGPTFVSVLWNFKNFSCFSLLIIDKIMRKWSVKIPSLYSRGISVFLASFWCDLNLLNTPQFCNPLWPPFFPELVSSATKFNQAPLQFACTCSFSYYFSFGITFNCIYVAPHFCYLSSMYIWITHSGKKAPVNDWISSRLKKWKILVRK